MVVSLILDFQRVHQLPACLARHKTLYLRSWGPITQPPVIVSQPFLLIFLNELLRKDPILVQPLCPTILDANGRLDEECLVDVPLPLEPEEKNGQKYIKGEVSKIQMIFMHLGKCALLRLRHFILLEYHKPMCMVSFIPSFIE